MYVAENGEKKGSGPAAGGEGGGWPGDGLGQEEASNPGGMA